MFSPRFAKFVGYGIAGFILVVFLFTRVYGWWTWKQYVDGNGTHEEIACSRCAEQLSRLSYEDDLTYRRERHDPYNHRWADTWNRNWPMCYAVFPQYPWRVIQ
jgi:hypothetical protein